MRRLISAARFVSHDNVRSIKPFAFVITALGLLLVSMSLIVPTGVSEASGSINGRVFLDYNQNGSFDSSGASPNYSVDLGLSGVTVTAFDASGTPRGSTTTGSTGTYTLVAAGSGPYRIEFTNLPSGFNPGTVGTNSDSAVRFVPDGNSSGVDLGVMSAKDYCQNNPELVTTCFAGTVNGNSADPVLVSFPYESGTTSTTSSAGVTDPSAHALMVPQNQLGSIWGLAYHRGSRKIFASAFTKRHAGFRNGNKGTASNDPTGEIFYADSTGVAGSLFVNINSLFGSNIAGDNPHDTTDYETDLTAFDAVGKTSFGDIDLSDDEETLFAINLNDRNLYAIPLGSGTPTSPTLSSQVTIYDLAALMDPGTGAAGCAFDSATPAGELNLNLRPGGLKFRDGKLYVGLTCTAQSTGNVSDLRAFVYELDPAGSGSAAQVANIGLDYGRGCISNNGTVCAQAEWLPWTNDVNDLIDFVPWGQKYYPQPWLIDIEFDQNDFMILGVADRIGHQTGNNNSGANTGSVEGVSAGDTLRMFKNGAIWSLESNGSDNTNSTAGAGSGEGPGGGEFYFQDGYAITSNVHSEIALGGLLNVPGYQDLVVSAYDPAPTNTLPSGQNTYRAGGMVWFNNTTGARSRSYQLFGIDTPNTFGKASGIGDLAAMCDSAPLQIGNRVWNDADSDGIQDPGEGVFANVALDLWADTDNNGAVDTQVGSVNTDSNGNYLFGGPNDSNMTAPCGSPSGSVDVRVNASSDDAEQKSNNSNVSLSDGDLNMLRNWNGNTTFSHVGVRFNGVSIPNGATVTSAYIEFTGNDSNPSSGNQAITIEAQAADNAGTFQSISNDIGGRTPTTESASWNPGTWIADQVYATPDLTMMVQEVVDRTNWADGNSMVFILSETATSGYRIAESFDGDSTQAPRLVVDFVVANTCNYKLLPETAYEIRVSPTNFNAGMPLENYLPTAPFADSSANGNSRDSDGIVFPGDEVKVQFSTGESGANDFKFDFGFRPGGVGASIYSLGNRVWFDTDNDGIIDPTESGISGVSVSIFLDAGGDGVPDTPGSPISTITTDANGYYRFDSLQANTYVVRINPANFGPAAVLEGYRNTAGNNTADAESYGAASNAENGLSPAAASDVLTNGILSNPVTLSPAAEPTNEADVPTSGAYAGQGSLDLFADMTVDFGFFGLSLSGTVWDDQGPGADNNDGELDAGETLLSNFVVRLYDSAGNEVAVGPDGILGTTDDAPGGVLTNGSGGYRFECLAQGDYRVVMNPAGNSSSTPTESDPNLNGDLNDNGFPDNTGNYPGNLISGMVTLTPGYAGAAGNNVVNMSLGHTADPTVDFGLLFAPTQVKLDTFEAYYKGNDVVLEWSSGFESDNLGFNVYRKTGGGSELLNPAPIAGSALRSTVELSVTGNDYRWIDRGPKSNSIYYLEDIDLNGVRTLHGPIHPKFSLEYKGDEPLSRLLTGLGRSTTRDLQKEIVGEPTAAGLYEMNSKVDSAKQLEIAAFGGFKIVVRTADRYRVSFEELAEAGFDTTSNHGTWQLFVDGIEVPMKVDDKVLNKHIQFFGRGFDSRFTDKQVYYLINSNANGKRLPVIENKGVKGVASSKSFRVTVSKKDRIIYSSAVLNGEKENWFGLPVLPSRDAVQELLVNTPDQAANTDARLSLRLQGLSDGQHLVNVSFNGVLLGTVDYSGKQNREFGFDVPMSTVTAGTNTVELRSAASATDVSLIDEVSLGYSKLYSATDGKLRFAVDAGQSARISGFDTPDIEVFELDSNGNAFQKIDVETETIDDTHGFGVTALGRRREFAAYSKQYRAPDAASVEYDRPSNWHSAENAADLLILAPEQFYRQASKFAEMRTHQGFRTAVVYIEDVFDEYGFGKKSDTALRNFLFEAYKDWSSAPRYVVLFGDSSYDMRHQLGQGDRDLIATRLIDTKIMETSSDAWFVDFDDDGVEDISIGRLPVGTAEEASQAVEKLKRYDRQNEQKRPSSLLVADKGFEGHSDILVELLPEDVSAVKLNRSALTDASLHDRLVDEINRGPSFVTYTGHGSTGVWSSTRVFSMNDADSLTNTRLSFVMVMSCLNGFVHNPYTDSLSESLFKAGNGAIAVWASSGSTYADDQIKMGRRVTRSLFDNSQRIGDLTREAKLSTDDLDARLTWQLIGDPTTVIK